MKGRPRSDDDQAPSIPGNNLPGPAKPISRRQWIGLAGGGVVTLAAILAFRRFAPQPAVKANQVTLYSEQECPCCHKWAAHMEGKSVV